MSIFFKLKIQASSKDEQSSWNITDTDNKLQDLNFKISA